MHKEGTHIEKEKIILEPLTTSLMKNCVWGAGDQGPGKDWELEKSR